MKTFKVYITETNKGYVRVNAESKEEAEAYLDENGTEGLKVRSVDYNFVIDEVEEVD